MYTTDVTSVLSRKKERIVEMNPAHEHEKKKEFNVQFTGVVNSDRSRKITSYINSSGKRFSNRLQFIGTPFLILSKKEDSNQSAESSFYLIRSTITTNYSSRK